MVGQNIRSITKKFKFGTTILDKNELGLCIPPGEIAELLVSNETHKWM